MEGDFKYMVNIGYGVGRYYEANKEYFEDNAVKLDYLCDARWKELGSQYDNIPVISPDDLLNMKDTYVIVMVLEKEAREQILQFLQKFNIPWIDLSTVLFRKKEKSMIRLVEEANVDHTLEKIENALQDLESQILFDARLRMSIYGNCGEIYQTLLSIPISEETMASKAGSNLLSTIRRLLTYQDTAVRTRVVLCKPSEESYAWVKTLGLKLDAVIEDSKYGRKYFLEYPTIDIDTAVEQYSDAIFISGSSPDGDIRAELIARGIPQENFKTRHMQLKWQYFGEPFIKPEEHEIFVDCGSLDLCNALDYIRLCNGKCDKVYALEPDKLPYEKCVSKLEQMEESDRNKIKLYNVAAWNSDTELSFVPQDIGGSRVCDYGKVIVKARSIDSILQGQRVTFIKMDIEGAELEALRGAQNSIKKWRPRLAICLYHKPEDIIELPAYLLSLVPDYKMYIRHYSTCIAETVLYCL